jgi:serralysin
MCILCALNGRDSATVHTTPTPQSLAAAMQGPQYAAGPAGGTGVPGDAVQALLAITLQDTARWNVPAAIGTPVATPGGMGTAVSLTYGFLATQAPQPADLVNFQPLNAGQQAGMRAALAAWADVARVSFTETAGLTADLRIGRSDQTSAGFAYFPGFSVTTSNGIITAATANPIAGDIYLSNTVADSIPPGSNGYQLALHESGHALGLKHSFEAPVVLPVETESRRYTVMSYTNAPNSGTVVVTVGEGGGYSWQTGTVMPSTPMLYDIAAMQALYGANTATRTGNDSYSWGAGEKFLATIWDGGGIDAIDASNQALRCVISLVDGSFSSIGLRQSEAELRMDIPSFATQVPTPSYNGQDNLAIAHGVVIENAYGGAGDDTITGNPLDNILDGGAGADTLGGGAGNDQYVIDNPGDVVTENANEGTDTAWVKSAAAVTLGPNIEIIRVFGAGAAVTGGATAEQIVANPLLASTLNGGAGDDVLWGSALNNVMNGGAGDDIIRSQRGGGVFSGGAGNDQFVVSNSQTTLVENLDEGIDTAWVTVNGFAVGDNIEITRLAGDANLVSGSNSDDQVVANPTLGSWLMGRGGNDVLWGSPFADTLTGGAGDDIIRGQGGADLMEGEAGNDQYVVLNPGVTILELTLQGYDTIWYAVSGQTMAPNTERANLSGTANSVTGNDDDNVIVGNPTLGNALLAGGAGNDTIFGGAGADFFQGGGGNDVLYSGGGADVFAFARSGFGYDQIAGFTQGLAKIQIAGVGFSDLFLNSAGGNTQVEVFGSAILVFDVGGMTAADFLFG